METGSQLKSLFSITSTNFPDSFNKLIRQADAVGPVWSEVIETMAAESEPRESDNGGIENLLRGLPRLQTVKNLLYLALAFPLGVIYVGSFSSLAWRSALPCR